MPLLHLLKDTSMPGKDALFGFQIRLERPDSLFMSAAEQNAVTSGKHVEIRWNRAVINLGLRQQYGQLTFDRRELFISEQSLRAQPATVHDHTLGERRQLGRLTQLPHYNAPASEMEVVHHRRQITVRLDDHGVELKH